MIFYTMLQINEKMGIMPLMIRYDKAAKVQSEGNVRPFSSEEIIVTLVKK